MTSKEEMEMLRASASGFLGEKAPISQLRRLRDDKIAEGFDRETWTEMGAMGWAGVLVEEAHGGVAMGHGAAGILMEEMGRTLTASPFLSSAIMGAVALSKYGNASQQEGWLPAIARAQKIIALAVDEQRHHNPAHVKLQAVRAGNGFKLSGEKCFVADCAAADGFIVSARTRGEEQDPDGITLFLVSRETQGISVENQNMIDSRNAGKVVFDDVALEGDAVLGAVDKGLAPLNIILDAGRAGLAAEMSGAAQECLDRTLSYLKERKQFGQTIGSFQALQHRAAHLYSEIEIGKSIVARALQMMDSAPEMAALMVSAAKAKLGQVALLAAQESIQMHGGIGMTDEFDIGFFIKRVRVADALYGSQQFHTNRYAELRGF